MARSLFSVPIFFIVFRETLEAVIIISVLLGLVEQIARPAVADQEARRGHVFASDWKHPNHPQHHAYLRDRAEKDDAVIAAGGVPELEREAASTEGSAGAAELEADEANEVAAKKLIRKLRIQIFAGAFLGLLIALSVGAAFIAVWFTQAANLWAKTEALWEGIFSLVAALIIMPMGLTMLKLDRARAKWRVKLIRAFDRAKGDSDKGGRTGRWVLFGLPLITVLREGMEAVVFVGGVALGQSATAIPIAAIVGLVCGLIIGVIIYAFASRSTLSTFLIVMTNFILLIGAGLFSKSVNYFQLNAFNDLLGADVDDTGGDGPGSYNVRGVVWHLDCCNPENNFDNNGWDIFNALFGWTNTATVGTVLAYVFYWLLAIALLVYMKFSEGRTTVFGYESAAGRRRHGRVAAAEVAAAEERGEKEEGGSTGVGAGAGVAELLNRG